MPTLRLADAHTCEPQEEPQEVVVITTSSVEGVQGELEIVQRRVAVPGTAKPVTPEVGEEEVVMVAVPDTTLHAPVPTVGVLAAKVVEVTLQRFWSGPAAAVVGGAFTVTEAVLACTEPQVLLAARV